LKLHIYLKKKRFGITHLVSDVGIHSGEHVLVTRVIPHAQDEIGGGAGAVLNGVTEDHALFEILKCEK
jgi:hypothetical protein